MASQDRTSTNLIGFLQELQTKTYDFGFFAALRELECVNRDKPRYGESLRPSDEPVRFGQEVSMEFAPSTLSSCSPGEEGRPWRLLVNFLGLLGPDGPLPLHLTEYIRDRLRNAKDPTLARFLDIFNHRMIALFYRAWAGSEPTVNLDRQDKDRFSTFVGSLCGLGMPSLQKRDAMPDWAKLHNAGWLSCPTRHADGLVAMLAGFFKVPVRLEEFIGRWIALPADCLCRLGTSPQNSTLGESMTIGSRIWDCQQTFRLTFGPLDFDRYQRFLPGRESLARLISVVRNYAGDEFAWELKLILKKEEVPEMHLGQMGQLGWTTWLKSGPSREDADDLVLSPVQ